MIFYKRLCTIAMVFFLSGQAGWASADVASDTEKLLNWAESTYPDLFPQPRTTESLPPWLYRFYPGMGIYAGVNADSLNAYVLGGPFGNAEPVLIDAL